MRIKVTVSLIAAWLVLVILSASADAQAISSPHSITFDFRNGPQGWQGGFADSGAISNGGLSG